MAQRGALSLVAGGEVEGVVLYHNVFPNVYVGQAGGTIFRNSFSLAGYGQLQDAYLEVGLIVPREGLGGFALLVNGITLTREIKPMSCAAYGDKLFCKMVYDITPVLRSKSMDTCIVEVEHRGINEIVVAHIGLLARVRHESARTRMVFYSGALAVAPGEKASIELPDWLSRGELRLAAYLPHQAATLALLDENGDEIARFEGTGFAEHTVQLRSAARITLVHKGSGSYFPREALISSLLVYSSHAPEPRIEADAKLLGTNEAEVVIRNTGTAEATGIIVVTFSRGMVLERKVVERVAPSEAKAVRLRAEPGSVIRVIWRHLDRTIYRDIKLKQN